MTNKHRAPAMSLCFAPAFIRAFAIFWWITAVIVSGDALAQQDHPLLGPSHERDGFVEQGIKNCVTASGKVSLAVLGQVGVHRYCECMIERSADAMTSDELAFEAKNNGPSPEFAKHADEIVSSCLTKVKTSLNQ